VRPGALAHVETTLMTSVARCKLTLGTSSLSLVSPRHEGVEWSWRVPARMASTTWHLRLRCGPQRASFTMRVKGRHHASVPSRLLVHARQSGPLLSGALVVPPPTSTPVATPACTDPLTCPPVNAPQMPSESQLFPLSQGECTDWADFKRPDIYYNQSASDTNATDWDAWTWGEHAQAEGLPVSTSPQVGDIAVWPQTADSQFGHVAYVESVSQGALTVSEMNAPGDLAVYQTPDGYTYYEKTWSLSDLSDANVVYIGS